MAVRFCGASACGPCGPKTVSQTFSGAFAPANVAITDTTAAALVSGVTFRLACPSSVSISAPLNITYVNDETTPQLMAVPIVIENVVPPVTTLDSAVPLTVLPAAQVKTLTPTEVLQLGAGTYRAYVTGQALVADSSFAVTVSGEINILAVAKQL